MHERGASSRRRKIDSRGEYCVGAVRLNDSDAGAPMRISRSVGILWLWSECVPRPRAAPKEVLHRCESIALPHRASLSAKGWSLDTSACLLDLT